MDFGQIKEITLAEAQKILSKDIAYITMKDGEVLVVNGLDHDKFDKREKENDNYNLNINTNNNTNNNFIEEQNKINTIHEDLEENERNSKLYNQNMKKIQCDNDINGKYPDFNNNDFVEKK